MPGGSVSSRSILAALIGAVMLLLGGAALLPAQRTSTSVMLADAMTAWDSSKYDAATGYARRVLQRSPSYAQRLRALAILAASLFPEDSAKARKPDAAAQVLADFVKIAPDSALPDEFNWSQLREKHDSVRRATFYLKAYFDTALVVRYPDTTVQVEVVASRPARVTLTVASIDKPEAPVIEREASLNQSVVIQIPLLSDRKRALPRGRYAIKISARETDGSRVAELTYHATVLAPPLELERVPVRPVEADLVCTDEQSVRTDLFDCERRKPDRRRSITAGLVATTLTVTLAALLRGNEFDAKSIVAGVAFGVGGFVAANHDPGVQLLENRARNLKRIRDAEARNEAKLQAFAAEVRIDREPRQP